MTTTKDKKLKLQSRKNRCNKTIANHRNKDDRQEVRVYKSLKYIYVKLMDKNIDKIVFSVSNLNLDDKVKKGKKGMEIAKEVGILFGNKCKEKKISSIKFNRSGYRYCGKIKALVEGIRSSGLKF